MTAVAPVVVETNGLWVGWSGQHLEDGEHDIPEANPNDRSPTAGLKSQQVIHSVIIVVNVFVFIAKRSVMT